MSVSNVGTSTDALQKQLKVDQKTLTQDVAKKASQATLEADQAKVTADQQAIKTAQEKAKAAKQTGNGHGVDPKAASSAASQGAGASTVAGRAGRVDVSA